MFKKLSRNNEFSNLILYIINVGDANVRYVTKPWKQDGVRPIHCGEELKGSSCINSGCPEIGCCTTHPGVWT
jgi:hypothetical protein